METQRADHGHTRSELVGVQFGLASKHCHPEDQDHFVEAYLIQRYESNEKRQPF